MRGNIILVEGAAGTGKTTLDMEFIYRGITEFNEPGIIVSFEITPDKLIHNAATLGWDLRALEEQRKIKIISTTRECFTVSFRNQTACCYRKRPRLARVESSLIPFA